MANQDCPSPNLTVNSENLLTGVLPSSAVLMTADVLFSGNLRLNKLNLISIEPHSPALRVSAVKMEKLTMLSVRSGIRTTSNVETKSQIRVNARLQSGTVTAAASATGYIYGLTLLNTDSVAAKAVSTTTESFSKIILRPSPVVGRLTANSNELTTIVTYADGNRIDKQLQVSSPNLLVTYRLLPDIKACQAVCSVRRVTARVQISIKPSSVVAALSNVAVLKNSTLLTDSVEAKLTATAGALTGRVFLETEPLNSILAFDNSIAITVNRNVVLADFGTRAVYCGMISSVSDVDMRSSLALSANIVTVSNVNEFRVQVPFNPVIATSILATTGVLNLNALDLGLAEASFTLNVNSVTSDNKVLLETGSVSATGNAFASPLRFSTLNLANGIIAFNASSIANAEQLALYRKIQLTAASCSIQSRTTSYFSTNIADISYPISIHDQVKYPIATATSFADPTNNDNPVYFAHGAFGAAVMAINTPGQLESSFSALLRANVCVNSGETYNGNLAAKSTIVLLRLSSLDTSSVRKFTMGNSAVGPYVNRALSLPLPTGYSDNISDSSSSNNGTSVLASGSVYSDARPLNASSGFGGGTSGGILLIANSLLRHNFNAGDSTTQPISVLTQFAAPSTATPRPTKIRVETTTNSNDDVGLAPVYSTTHLAYLTPNQLSSMGASNSSFEFKAGLRRTSLSGTTPQNIHSSDSMFSAFMLKPGVKHQFVKYYVNQPGVYSISSAGFENVPGAAQKYCVSLQNIDGDLVNAANYQLPCQLRLRIGSYRGLFSNRSVDVDIPVVEIYQGKFVIDSSYRWFAEVSKPGAIFYNNASIQITRDIGNTNTSYGNAVLLVTRPNVVISNLPVSEQAGGDQGESDQALLSNAFDRNLLIGEFSLGISRTDSTAQSTVQVSTGSNNGIITYSGSDEATANSVSSFDPKLIQLIIDEAGNLKGQVRSSSSSDGNTTDNINAILPASVKNYIAAGGKFTKVIVGQNAIGLLSTPASNATTGRKLFVWGSNIYGHLIPPSSESYETFIKEGYIENVKDFDIAAAYMCIIKDDGSLKCWGCDDSYLKRNTNKSCWKSTNNTSFSIIDGAIGGQHMVLKLKDANSTEIKQYGNVSQNIPYVDGWSDQQEGSIACGQFHVAAIRADKTVVCWGSNDQGQCTVPAGLTDVKQVACGDNHTLALKEDGTIVAWGDNTHNQLSLASITNLKAKSIFAGGSYSGAIRAANSTDIQPTDSAYSDVEDTAIIVGNNNTYLTHIPLCEGKSYDPTYPRYRMKFHKIIGGWDHVIGIRKVESNFAGIIHPELCRIVNHNQIKLILKTANGTPIFNGLNIKSLITTNIPFVNGYLPDSNGQAANGVFYRIFQETPGPDSCTVNHKLQKLVNGSWTDVVFQLNHFDVNGQFVSLNNNFTSISKINAIWNGSAEGLPSWQPGIHPLCSADLPGSYFISGISEYIDVDYTAADNYGFSNTNNSLVCWGNPISYYQGYNRDDYISYGIDQSIFGLEIDLRLIDPNLPDRELTQRSATANYAAIEGNSSNTIPKYWALKNSPLYTGRLIFASSIEENSLEGPLVVEASEETPAENQNLYVGPVTAYLVPLGKSFGGLYTPMITRLSLLNSSNPEEAILNTPIPVQLSDSTYQVHSYYTGHTSSSDSTFNNRFGITQYATKCLDSTAASEINSSNYWMIVSHDYAPIQSYGWGKSPTGYWYVYDNTSNNLSAIQELDSRYYNFTGAYVVLANNVIDENTYQVKLPFNSNTTLNNAVLNSLGLGVRRFYIVKHQTNRFVTPNYNSRSVAAGKHLSILPASSSVIALNSSRYGLNVESGDGVLNDTNVAPGVSTIWSNWIPHAIVNLGNALTLFAGYRSLYPVSFSNLQVFGSGIGSKYLQAFPQGDNSQGQLSTAEYYEAFVAGSPLHTPNPSSTYHPSWFMSVGQKTLPSTALNATFTKVSCGQYHSLAIDEQGKVHAWGSDNVIFPATQNSTEWIPYECLTPSSDSCISPFMFYGAVSDSIYENRPSALAWPANYVTESFRGGVPSELSASSGNMYLPYSSLNPDIYAVAGGTIWSSNLNSLNVSQIGSNISSYRNGGFALKVTQTDAGYVVEAGTDIEGPKYYSDPLDISDLKLFSWGYEYDLSDDTLKLKARLNGNSVLWNGDSNSPVVSTTHPLNTLIAVGSNNPGNNPMFEMDGEALSAAITADSNGLKPIAGRNFAGFVLNTSSEDNCSNSKKLLIHHNGQVVKPTDSCFEEVAVGAASNTDWLMYKVKRNYRVTGPATPTGIYAGATSVIANRADNYRIYVGNNVFNNDGISYQSVDYNSEYDSDTLSPGWPKVVFPGDPFYDSLGLASFDPTEIGLFRFSNKVYPSMNHFDLVQIRNLKIDPEPSNETFDVDYVRMQIQDGGIGETTVYDSVTKKVVSQYFIPTEAEIPAGCLDIMSSERTSFASSNTKLYSWGQSYQKSRAYNLTNYDTYSVSLPPLTSLSSPARPNAFFRGAGIANDRIYVWGLGTKYHQNHPNLSFQNRIHPAAANIIWYSFSIDNPTARSPVSGFKKVLVADWFSAHPNGTLPNSSEFYIGIDANNKIKTFKVIFESLGVAPNQEFAYGYLKYVDSPSIWFSDFGYHNFSVPQEIENEEFKDIQLNSDSVVALTTDGRVYCWGPSTVNFNNNHVVYGFDEICHECADNSFDDIQPSASQPSAKTKLNSNSSSNPVIDIAVSYNHAAALRQDGSVLIWGFHTQYVPSYVLSDPLQQNNPFKNATPTNKPLKLGSNANYFAALRSNGILETWGATGDSYDTVQSIDLGGTSVAKISKNAAASHFVGLKEDGTVVAWGAGKLGATGTVNYGQSDVPSLNNPKAVVANLSDANVTNVSKMLVRTRDNFSSSLNAPPEIRAEPGNNEAVLASDIEHLTNVVTIAAGQSTGFAIINSTFGATQGTILQWGSSTLTPAPTGSNWKKVAASKGILWSHAAALDTDGLLAAWGIDSYWSSVDSENSYTDIACSDDAIVALRTNGLVDVFSPNLQSLVKVPTYLQNVTFKSISVGANHVIGIVKTAITQTTPNGEFVLSVGDVVAWGDNTNSQCSIPGYVYGSSTNLPVQSTAVAAGYRTSLIYRLPLGIGFKFASSVDAAAFFRPSNTNMELAEGYMAHSLVPLCDNPLNYQHPYSLIPPEKLTNSQVNTGFNTPRAHSRNFKFVTKALNVPSYLSPGSSSPRKAKLVSAGRFAGYNRRFNVRSLQSAGYSVIVEEGATDRVTVIGGEYLPSGCSTTIPVDASLAIRQIPDSLSTENLQLVSVSSHRGYIYALDSEGVMHSWGFDESVDYFQVNAISKKNLYIPPTSINDLNIFYTTSSVRLAASYVTGVPGFSSSWSAEVSLNRNVNGSKTVVRKFVATGSTNKVSIAGTRYFAQGFVALDTWPQTANSLDTYYSLDLKFTGGGLRHQVYSASLAVINVDSRTSTGQKIMVQATGNASGPIADFAVVNKSDISFTANPIQTRNSLTFNNFAETNAGILVDYTSEPEYPTYLRNSYGGSARIENINSANNQLLLQGRIAQLETNLSGMQATRIWTYTGINPVNGSNGANLQSWANITPNANLSPKPAPAAVPTIVVPFTTGTRAVKLPGSTDTTAAGLIQLDPNLIISTFTYFVVKKNTYDSESGLAYNPHSIFTACDKRLAGNTVWVHGLGERGRKPGVLLTYQGNIHFAETENQVIEVGVPQIVTAYLGDVTGIWNQDTNKVGIRVNGTQQALLPPNEPANYNVAANNSLNSGYYLGVSTINPTTALREKDTEYAEVIAFDRLLSLNDIKFVEGYLAWRHGIQNSLPIDHPYRSVSPTRGQLDALRPLNYDEDPLDYVDVGVAARQNPETWLALYDVNVEYQGKRLSASNQPLDDHAPLVVELELNQTITQGLITTNIGARCTCQATEIDIERDDSLPFGRSFGRAITTAAENSFFVTRNNNFSNLQSAAKLDVKAALNLDVNLLAVALTGKLTFWRGTDCGPIYGCESYEAGDPNLDIIRINQPMTGVVSAKCNITSATILVINNIRYLNVNSKINVNSPVLGGPRLLTPNSINIATRVNELLLRDIYFNIADAGTSRVTCRSNVAVCSETGFLVKTPKYKPNTTVSIFPTKLKLSKIDIDNIGNSFF
jgi:alpha-tubulin suppressor-like RCC1 family protein